MTATSARAFLRLCLRCKTLAVGFGEFDGIEFEFGGERFLASGHGCLVLLLEA